MELSKERPKLIKTWQELSECLSKTHILEIDLEFGGGWITSKNSTEDFEAYLSTHTFYGGYYKSSTKVLQKYGFNVTLANWDE